MYVEYFLYNTICVWIVVNKAVKWLWSFTVYSNMGDNKWAISNCLIPSGTHWTYRRRWFWSDTRSGSSLTLITGRIVINTRTGTRIRDKDAHSACERQMKVRCVVFLFTVIIMQTDETISEAHQQNRADKPSNREMRIMILCVMPRKLLVRWNLLMFLCVGKTERERVWGSSLPHWSATHPWIVSVLFVHTFHLKQQQALLRCSLPVTCVYVCVGFHFHTTTSPFPIWGL